MIFPIVANTKRKPFTKGCKVKLLYDVLIYLVSCMIIFSYLQFFFKIIKVCSNFTFFFLNQIIEHTSKVKCSTSNDI